MDSHTQNQAKRLLHHHMLEPIKDDVYIVEGGQEPFIVQHPDAAKYGISKPQEIEITPTSFTAGTFNNNPIEFRVQRDLCGEIEMAYVEMTVTETSAAATVTPVVASYLIDTINIY